MKANSILFLVLFTFFGIQSQAKNLKTKKRVWMK